MTLTHSLWMPLHLTARVGSGGDDSDYYYDEEEDEDYDGLSNGAQAAKSSVRSAPIEYRTIKPANSHEYRGTYGVRRRNSSGDQR